MKEYHEPRYKLVEHPITVEEAQAQKERWICIHTEAINEIDSQITELEEKLKEETEKLMKAKGALLERYRLEKVEVRYGEEGYEGAKKYGFLERESDALSNQIAKKITSRRPWTDLINVAKWPGGIVNTLVKQDSPEWPDIIGSGSCCSAEKKTPPRAS